MQKTPPRCAICKPISVTSVKEILLISMACVRVASTGHLVPRLNHHLMKESFSEGAYLIVIVFLFIKDYSQGIIFFHLTKEKTKLLSPNDQSKPEEDRSDLGLTCPCSGYQVLSSRVNSGTAN